jgi:hypothetical protein
MTAMRDKLKPLAGMLAAALSDGCGSGEAKYPEGSQAIYCTNVVDDCAAQASEQCPHGYTVLHTEKWSTNLGAQLRGGGLRTPVRHTSIRIMCETETQRSE